jgi:hypothetical protein
MHDLDAWPGGHRDSQIVFIGKGLPFAELVGRFESAVLEPVAHTSKGMSA